MNVNRPFSGFFLVISILSLRHGISATYWWVVQAVYNFLAMFLRKRLLLCCVSGTSDSYGNIPCIESYFSKTEGRASVVNISQNSSIFYVLWSMASARIILVDQSFLYVSRLNFHKHTTCVQCWHGGGSYKKVGFHALRKNFNQKHEMKRVKRIHKNINWFIISDNKLCESYADAFCLDIKQVLPLGLPRTDLLINRNYEYDKKKLAEIYPEARDRRLVLYAPTFRVGKTGLRYHPWNLDVSSLARHLQGDWIFAVRQHPSVHTSVPEGWLDLSALPQEFCLSVADSLISDYSSIIFDYSLLRRPIILYVPDLETYRAEQRGLYHLPYDLSPDGVCNNEQDVADKLCSGAGQSLIHDRFMNACDGRSTQRVGSFLSGLIGDAE